LRSGNWRADGSKIILINTSLDSLASLGTKLKKILKMRVAVCQRALALVVRAKI
jgi:hypothetical protein